MTPQAEEFYLKSDARRIEFEEAARKYNARLGAPALMCSACQEGDHGSIGADLAHRDMRCSCACHGGK